MNKERRKQLEALSQRAELIRDDLENVLSDEQEYFDNIPENLQYSQRAGDSEEAMDLMNSAIECIDEAIEIINNIL